MSGLSRGSFGSNTGPYSFVACTLLTEPSPQTPLFLLRARALWLSLSFIASAQRHVLPLHLAQHGSAARDLLGLQASSSRAGLGG